MYILGISCYYHDSASALIKDGEVLAAAQEERFTRKKHDSGFPSNAIVYALEQENISISEIDAIVYYEKPFLKFERLLETFLTEAPFGFKLFLSALPVWLKEKLFLKKLLIDELLKLSGGKISREQMKNKLSFCEHHESHSASAFYPSPFEEAAVLTLDGVGEWTTTSLSLGNGNKLKILKEIHFPHSIGLFYSAFTYYLGFKVNSGEYKVMGLAPYGEPKYTDIIKKELIDIKSDGSFRLNMKYFNFTRGLTMVNSKFEKLFDKKIRTPETDLIQKDMDIAASLQAVTEEIVIKLAKDAKKTTGSDNLCLAGGVALNCVANGKILEEKIFKDIWIQPAAGDAGGALGAALAYYYSELGKERIIDNKNLDAMKGSYLGPSYSSSQIESYLKKYNAKFDKISDDDELSSIVTKALSEGKVIGWHKGRMEFGPRALGARSIIGDPRNEKMQSVMNLKIKYRESFRPFAPSVLREKVNDYFDLNYDSPYMLLVSPVKGNKRINMNEDQKKLFGIDKLNIPRSEIPAVTHVDYSARVQTVHKQTNPCYHNLINHFSSEHGCPVVVNTSFNVRGEPIVNTPEDSYKCFMRTEMDMLVIDNYILRKESQPEFNDKQDWKEEFELD